MKKSLFALATIYLLIVALSYRASAQGTNNAIAFSDNKAFTKSLENLAFVDNSVVATYGSYVNLINAKAVRHFKKTFGESRNETWFRIPDGFLSYFTADGLTNRVLYDKKGNWQYTVKFYSEEKLPRDIRAMVKSTYFDYAITVVEEIEATNNLVYVVHIEDKTSIKNIRISKDGEMDIMEEFIKSKE